MLPSIIAGLTTAAYKPGWAANSGDAFVALTTELRALGIFEYGLVTLLSCSALAAIMSSADSVLLGASNVISVDLFKCIWKPDASELLVVRFGELCSVVLTIISIAAGMRITSSEFLPLLLLQNGVLIQILPAFLFGLYFDIPARALTAGMICGVLAFFPATVLLVGGNAFFSFILPPNFALGVNFQVMVLVMLFCPSSQEDQERPYAVTLKKRFQDSQLTMQKIRKTMSTTVEPSKVLGWVTLVLSIGIVPWYGKRLGEGLVLGMPRWAAAVLGFVILEFVVIFFWVKSWVPVELPQAAEEKEVEPEHSVD